MNHLNRITLIRVLIIALGLAIAGCGGSSGSSDEPEPEPVQVDTDGDGIADVNDTDDDNDGTQDSNDDFPKNPSRTKPIEPLFPYVDGEFQLPTTPAANQMTWIVEQLANASTSISDINNHFDSDALTNVSAVAWQDFFSTLRNIIPGGTIRDIVTMTPTQINVLVGNESDPGSGQYMSLTVGYASGLIRSFSSFGFPLNGGSTELDIRSFNYEQTAERLDTLTNELGILVARIDSDNQCVPIYEQNPAQPFSTASIFKVWVMGALAQAIEDGTISSFEELSLTSEYLTPSGTINSEPLGTTFPVSDLATLMLGISDNTATEMLLRLVGRERLESILTEYNHANSELMTPFLSMNEAFHLYWTVSQEDVISYIDGTEQYQRDYVNNTLEPLGRVTSYPQENAIALVDALWQGSPYDVCYAIAGLRKLNDTTEGFMVADRAYGAETVGVNIRSKWERVWFKGGSLADSKGQLVTTFGWLLESDDRGAFVVVAMGNNDPALSPRIDLGLFARTALRLVDIVNETN